MCWKWKYSCGHTADIECDSPKKKQVLPTSQWPLDSNFNSPNSPRDDNLSFYCSGWPVGYADVKAPCQKCLNAAATVEDVPPTTNGDKNPKNFDGGAGNNTYGADWAATGWINTDYLGVEPWNKLWMIPGTGMKVDDDGYIVEDPTSKISRECLSVRNDTHDFDPEADYETFHDDLEAVSSAQAYANIPAWLNFVRPINPFVIRLFKKVYPGPINFNDLQPTAVPPAAAAVGPFSPLSPLSPASSTGSSSFASSGSSNTLADSDATTDADDVDEPSSEASFHQSVFSAVGPVRYNQLLVEYNDTLVRLGLGGHP